MTSMIYFYFMFLYKNIIVVGQYFQNLIAMNILKNSSQLANKQCL